MSSRKHKNALMPSVLPSLEDILEEPAIKNCLHNIAQCAMKKRADRVQANAGKRRPKRTEKSSPANHSTEPKRRLIGKRHQEGSPPTRRYSLRRRPKKEEFINKQSARATTKRPRKPIPPSPCSIEPERERSNVETISVWSTCESPIVRAGLPSMEVCSSQTLQTPSDMYSAELHSLENINNFETTTASFRKDSSQHLIGQTGNAVSTPKARNENGLDIFVDDFGIEYAFYEDPMRYTVTIEILDSPPPEMTEKAASASGGDLTLQAVAEDCDSATLVLATKTSVDTTLLTDKTALTISDAEHVGSQSALAACAHADERVESTYAFEEQDLTRLHSEEHDVETTVAEALASIENSTRLSGDQHDFGGGVRAGVLPPVQESMPLLVEEEDADATRVLPSTENGHLIVTPGCAKGELKDPSAFLPPELLASFATPTASSSSADKPTDGRRETLQPCDKTPAPPSTESSSDDALATTVCECRQSSLSQSTTTYAEYEITERVLSSDEECGRDDEKPPKKIPPWANGDQLKLAYVAQLEIEHPERIFAGCQRPITLNEVFGTEAELDSIRSSAQWDTSSGCGN